MGRVFDIVGRLIARLQEPANAGGPAAPND